jgi:hypothetical protein
MESKKFGTGGNVNYTYGGKNQVNKQRTRGGSIFGVQKSIPNESLNKYVGKKEGGEVKHDDVKMDKKVVKKAVAMHDKQLHGGKKTDLKTLKGGGCAKMAKGGKPDVKIAMSSKKAAPAKPTRPTMPGAPAAMPVGSPMMGRAPAAMPQRPAAPMMAKGGLAAGHKAADGIAKKGKTKGTEVKMARGGKTKKYC